MHQHQQEHEMSLTITKTREMLYRAHCWGSEYILNDVTCWHVIDAATGEMVAGGFDKGSNATPGRPILRRRKDAAAFVAGYNAYLAGQPMRYSDGDDDQRIHFSDGYLAAMQKNQQGA